MSEWKECTLGDVLNLRRGYDLPHSEMIEGNIPVAGSNGVIGSHNVATNIEPCITVGRSGSAGSTYMYDKAWAHNTTLYIDDFKGNNPKYLYYMLLSLPLKKMAGGSAVPSLNRNHIHPLEIRFPKSLSTQNKIASILSSLDDKIAVNKKICENLEAQAQALFKHWFIDFVPFKDGKFVESELGMIPEGWTLGSLGDVIKVTETGKRPKGGAESEGIPSIGAEKIERIGYYDFSSEKYISKDFFDNMKKGKIKNGDVLLYKDGAYTGKSTIFMNNFPYAKCAVNEHVFILRTGNSKWQCWLYLCLSYEPIRKYIYTLASSKAAQPGLNQVELMGVKIVIPPVHLLDEFESLVSSLLSPIIQHLKENQQLSTLRDTLLPKLMSGQIKL